jgi:hypothetical protein
MTMRVEREAGTRTGQPDVTLSATQEMARRNLTYCRDCHCDLGGGDCAVCHLTPLALRVLVALRERALALEQIETHPDGTLWGRVCSADVTVAGMGAAQKAGYCTALMRVGVYYLEPPMLSNVREWRGWRPGRTTLGKVRF